MQENLNWQPLFQLPRVIKTRFDTPVYVYNTAVIKQRARQLQSLFAENFSISYAVKSNPNQYVLSQLSDLVESFDVSSIGEVQRVLATGVNPDRITFSGPAKRDVELETAIQFNVGELVVESLEEAQRISDYCQRAGKIQKVLLRITPSKTPKHFGASMAGKASQFGIEEEQLDHVLENIIGLKGLDVCGFHIYLGSNCLSVDSLIESFTIMLESFSNVTQNSHLKIRKLIFGAGFGVPYLESDSELDIEKVASKVNQLLFDFRQNLKFKDCHCMLELGRWLVGPAGVLLTSVVSAKTSRGRHIRLCDAGFNNHLAAFGLMGAVVRRNWRIHNITTQATQTRKYNLVGPLCTAIDVMANDIELPLTECGDVLAIENSGAYGFTASPIGFISHPAPKEIALIGSQLLDVSEPLCPAVAPKPAVVAADS